jgi:large subunit ribosomal protein L29
MKRREELNRLNELSDEDLKNEVARLKESLFRLNFKLALGEMDTVRRIREEKKSLARIFTLMRERESKQAVA